MTLLRFAPTFTIACLLACTDETAAPELRVCGTDSPGAIMGCVERARYEADLLFIAQPRAPGSNHWQAVQDFGAARLRALGFDVELHAYESGVNVVGIKRGTQVPHERVMVSAHYDHIAGCDGADDNASGVAAALEVARVLSSVPLRRTLVFALWDEEEAGLVGSTAYARRARARNDHIVAHYVLETVGFASSEPNTQRVPDGLELQYPTAVDELRNNAYRGDFIAVVSDRWQRDSVRAFTRAADAASLKTVHLETTAVFTPPTLDLRRSDHAAFWGAAYSAVMLTDSAEFRNPNYHCVGGPDVPDVLDHEFTTKVTRATVGAAAIVAELAH